MVKARLIKNETIIEIEAVSEVKRVNVSSAKNHNSLYNRNLPDQHPISAITGLQEELDTIPDDYVSAAELESALLEKQDLIIELSEIRQGAALGATAVQPVDLAPVATSGDYDDLNNKPTIPTDTCDLTNNAGYITGITSGDVTTALGYIPYDASNPSGYTSNVGTVTSVNNVNPVSGNVTISIPTATSDLTNDSGFITLSALTPYATQTWVENKGYITSSALTPYALISSLATVATSGNYNDLTNKPTIPTVNNATLTIQKNSSDIDTFTANASVDKIINITVPTTAGEVSALPDSTKYGASIDLSLDTTNYKLTLTLKDQDGNTLKSVTVDFPIESVVVNGSYDAINQKIILTLQNGNTIDIPVGALIAGLQTEITSSNKLDADLVDDSTSTNKFVTSSDKTTWNSKQDAISDLSAIRTNATNGASAYTTIQGYGNIVTHNVSEFATSAQGTLADSAVQPADLATVATTGSYNDLSNKPTIPAAQVNSDWNATSGVAQILNKPTIPTDTSDLTNGAGYITSSALSGYAVDSAVVHKTGNETVGGVKTFSSDMYITNNQPFLYLRQTSFDKGDVPASQISASVNFLDGSEVLSGAHQLSSIGTEILTSGDIRCFLRAFKNAVNVSTNAQIAIYYPTTGSAYTECPTPTENTTTSKQIDTVGARNTALSSYVLHSSLATVATSGSYNDLTNKPTIPTDTSDLTNGAGYITSSALSGYQTTSNLVTSISSSSTNTQYPSAKCVYDIVGDIETLLAAI